MHTICMCICVLLLLFIGKLQGNADCYPLSVHWLYVNCNSMSICLAGVVEYPAIQNATPGYF